MKIHPILNKSGSVIIVKTVFVRNGTHVYIFYGLVCRTKKRKRDYAK